MAWYSISVAIVGWLVGSLVVTKLRGKLLSKPFVVLVLICSTLGAAAVQYIVYRSIESVHRLSGAHFIGVTSLRIKDDAEFIKKYLTKSDGSQPASQDLDWGGTFKSKAEEISETLAAIQKNSYISENYAVWSGDIEFRRGQLDRVAERTAIAVEGRPRQINVNTYLEALDLTAKSLDNLSSEMRSRRPELYYTNH
jgi:hypothetical protein